MVKEAAGSKKKPWKIAKENFLRAIRSEGDFVDSVRIDLTDYSYLGELGSNKYWTSETLDDHKEVKKLTPEELKEREVSFNSAQQKMYFRGSSADTGNFLSKGTKGVAAFIMDKQGHLYIEEHKTDQKDAFFHGSFLDDRPAEMAGLITIEDGKITFISNNSGHYKPQTLDMYRGIKKLYSQYPAAFAPNCTVDTTHVNNLGLKDFFSYMEKDVEGVPYHEKLRNERIEKIKDYRKHLDLLYFIDDVRNNRLEQVEKKLIENPTYINQQDNFGNTALSVAIGNSSSKTELFLRDKGATKLGTNALFYAVEIGNIEAIKRLKNLGIDFNQNNESGQTAMHIAATLNKPELIKTLYKEGTSYNTLDKKEQTPLDCAIQKNASNSIQAFYDLGVDVNHANSFGVTPIHLAAQNGSNESIEKLCSLNAKINAEDLHGETPLHYAAAEGLTKTVELLKEKGAEINAINNRGQNALHMVSGFRSLEVDLDSKLELFNKLIELGININEQDKDKKTPMHYLVHSDPNHIELLNELIKAGADPNSKDYRGRTSLHYAAYQSKDDDNYARYFAKLLEAYPNLTILDNNKKNPIQALGLHKEKVGIYINELNKNNPEKIARIIANIISNQDKKTSEIQENWDLVGAIINKIPEEKKLEIIQQTIELNKKILNSSQRNRLINFLEYKDQKILKAQLQSKGTIFSLSKLLRASMGISKPSSKNLKTSQINKAQP